LLLGALAANCCLAQAAVAQWQAPEGPDAAIEQSRVAAQLLTTNGRVQIPGVSVAVVLDGHVVWADAFGYANVELRAPSTQDTRFRIASISKTFTGTLLARLAEAGRLDLDAHIRTIDPDLPEHYDAVTVRQLARHTAGVRSYATGEVAVPDYYETLADALQVFINDPLLFEPGASYRYSTYGYTLLGHVMEKACGESYYELLRKYVLEPLDLRTVALDHRYFIRQNRAEHYEWSQQYGVTNAQPLDNSVKYPGGGLIATADDLARFGYAMAAPGFLSEEALKGMLSPTILPDGSEVDDSAGWTLRQDGRGRRVYGHSGAQPGTRSQMWVYPQLGVAMAVLSNLSNRPLGFDEFQVLAEPFVKLAEGHEPGPAAVDATGSYRFEIQLDDEETLTGTLDVWPKALGGGYGASIHVDRDGSGFELPSVAVHGRDVRIVGFTVGQLIELDFELSDDGAGTGTAMVGRMRPLTVSRR
jgi:CubicO group peptidase (beta-lactamase class C family)